MARLPTIHKANQPIAHTRGMRVTFGKYKGLLVEEILDENAGWLVWAHENVEHFRLDEDIYQEAMARDVQRRARNEIKRYAEYNFWGDFDD